MTLETTINAQTREWLPEASLAGIIKQMEFPAAYAARIYNLFADVPLADSGRFAAGYGIADQTLQQYYRSYIRPVYPNPELEEMLAYAG